MDCRQAKLMSSESIRALFHKENLWLSQKGPISVSWTSELDQHGSRDREIISDREGLTGFHNLKMKQSFQYPFQTYIQMQHTADHLVLETLDATPVQTHSEVNQIKAPTYASLDSN